MLLPVARPQPTFIIFDPPASTGTQPSAITPNRAIVGSYTDAGGLTHGFLRTPDSAFTTVDVPGSALTVPTDITPYGVITGWYCDAADCLNQAHPKIGGFVRAVDGSFTTFRAPVGSYILGSIYDFLGAPPPSINPLGAIVGTYSEPGGSELGFLGTPGGTFTPIDYPGASFTEVLAINPAGAIVGDFCDADTCYRGFVRTPNGTFKVIGPPGEFVETIPGGGINSA